MIDKINVRLTYLQHIRYSGSDMAKQITLEKIALLRLIRHDLNSQLSREQQIIEHSFDSGVQSQINPEMISTEINQCLILSGCQYFKTKFYKN